MWRITRSGAAATLTIELFDTLGRRERDAGTGDGRTFLALAAPASEHDVRFGLIT